ncbi:hypothetical protein JVU11DRAFT_1199 [Chiua virens]|nr:hypothetical protein JVU11DRAFT_1199 [Chiua virens]
MFHQQLTFLVAALSLLVNAAPVAASTVLTPQSFEQTIAHGVWCVHVSCQRGPADSRDQVCRTLFRHIVVTVAISSLPGMTSSTTTRANLTRASTSPRSTAPSTVVRPIPFSSLFSPKDPSQTYATTMA